MNAHGPTGEHRKRAERTVFTNVCVSRLLTRLVRVHEGAHAEAHAAQQLTQPAEMMTERELIRKLDKTHTYLLSVFCHPNVLIAERLTTRNVLIENL